MLNRELKVLDSYLHLSCNHTYHYCSGNAHAKKTQKILQFSKQKNTLKSAESWYFMERRSSSRRRINVQALKKSADIIRIAAKVVR